MSRDPSRNADLTVFAAENRHSKYRFLEEYTKSLRGHFQSILLSFNKNSYLTNAIGSRLWSGHLNMRFERLREADFQCMANQVLCEEQKKITI